MLQRKSEPVTLFTHWFMVAAELEEGQAHPEQVSDRLADSLGFIEGIGKVDVDYMGKLEEGDEQV